MQIIENYEIVLSGEKEDRLLLTFNWNDITPVPRKISDIIFEKDSSQIKVIFEDNKHWEEVSFVDLPLTLHDIISQFKQISIVGLTEDNVEFFQEFSLTVI